MVAHGFSDGLDVSLSITRTRALNIFIANKAHERHDHDERTGRRLAQRKAAQLVMAEVISELQRRMFHRVPHIPQRADKL